MEVGAPVASVVIVTYNGRARIDEPLRSLRAQDTEEAFEVVVVDSGDDDCSRHVRDAFPEVRLVRSKERLWPGRARNRGVAASRGRIVAFVPDDCAVPRDWLRRRLDAHRAGLAAVGGAIVNGTPWHPVGTAGYLLEYSALLPSDTVLRGQAIPHCLSYERDLIEQLGGFPEDTATGEDTVLNRGLLATGARVGFDARIRLAHRNPTSLRKYLRHQHEHGRGLRQCAERHALMCTLGPSDRPLAVALYRTFAWYPIHRWWRSLLRVAHGRPRSLPAYLALTPLVWAGLLATALGAWTETRKFRLGEEQLPLSAATSRQPL